MDVVTILSGRNRPVYALSEACAGGLTCETMRVADDDAWNRNGRLDLRYILGAVCKHLANGSTARYSDHRATVCDKNSLHSSSLRTKSPRMFGSCWHLKKVERQQTGWLLRVHRPKRRMGSISGGRHQRVHPLFLLSFCEGGIPPVSLSFSHLVVSFQLMESGAFLYSSGCFWTVIYADEDTSDMYVDDTEEREEKERLSDCKLSK